MMVLSVIIPTYNRAAVLERAVASVLGQKTDHPVELLVVDDGSSDETPKRLASFRHRLTLLTHHRNRGVSAARNTGIRYARGSYIAFLDSDDCWLPQKLAVQAAFMLQRPSELISQTDEIWIRNGRRVNPKKKHLKPDGDIFKPSLERCLVSPSAVMVKRTLFEQVGFFDEGLPACEDYDLWLRISARWPVHFIPQKLTVRYGGHPDQLSARFRGMDRFRIVALAKILRSGVLDPGRKAEAWTEMARKCTIYGNGCLRRGKRVEGIFYLNLPKAMADAAGIAR